MKRMVDDKEFNGVLDKLENGFSGDNASTKKIYCHPIQINSKINSNGSVKYRLTALIFNNSSTPFTLSSFKTFIDDLKTATEGSGTLMMSGAVVNIDNKVIIVSRMYKSSANLYLISGLDTTGEIQSYNSADFNALLPSATTVFIDGVNAIN